MGTLYETDVVAWAKEQTMLDMPKTWIWPLDVVLDDSFWPE